MEQAQKSQRVWLKIVLLVFVIYVFMVSIELLGISLKMAGENFAKELIATTSHPLVGLFIGILATSVIQSSSATTSITVGMVAAGTLTLRNAVPIIMGANMGTTVTNTLVSLGCVTMPQEFRRAFASATVHDFFNLLSVLVFLPIEAYTHFLEIGASLLSNIFANIGGLTLISPIKIAVAPTSHFIIDVINFLLGKGTFSTIVGVTLSVAMLLLSLVRIVSLVKSLIIGKAEILLHNYIFCTPMRSFIFGLILTVLVQSSSVTTSLIIPLAAAGILSLEQVFPYTLGANIGTTVTALLASLVAGTPEAISAALVHTLFNVCGTVVWFPLRKIPMGLAHVLAEVAYRKRPFAIAYVVIVFFVIPIILLIITGGL